MSREFGRSLGCWSSPEESGPSVPPRCWIPVQVSMNPHWDSVTSGTLTPRYALHSKLFKAFIPEDQAPGEGSPDLSWFIYDSSAES